MKILKELLGCFIIGLIVSLIARTISDTFTSGYIAGMICLFMYILLFNE